MSQKYFIHATPTLFHAGTEHPAMLSCFLLGIEESVVGIYKCLSDCAQISKFAGGIGVHVSNIRASDSLIRTTGTPSSSDNLSLSITIPISLDISIMLSARTTFILRSII